MFLGGKMRKIFVLSGIPGCEKSTWANKFKVENPNNTFIIASDDIRMEIGGAYQYFEEENRVWDLFFGRANDMVSKFDEVNIILDSTCLTNKLRLKYFGKLHGYNEINLVCFDTDPEVCRKRNKLHIPGKIVKDAPLETMIKSREAPDSEIISLYNNIITVE